MNNPSPNPMFDTVAREAARHGQDWSRHAHRAWKRRSKREQGGIYALLTLFALIGLGALIWRAGRKMPKRYQSPIEDETEFY